VAAENLSEPQTLGVALESLVEKEFEGLSGWRGLLFW